MSSGGDCRGEVWVLIDGLTPLSWCFSGGGGIGIGELCNLELADVGEKHV